MSALCRIGLHRYESIPVLMQSNEYVRMTLDGDVCKACGKLKDADSAKSVLLMMMANWPQTPIVVHPSVRK